MPIQYTDQGIETQILSEILEERQEALATPSILGTDFVISNESAAGNLQLSDADREFDIQELIQFLAAQLNPETCEGVFLDWVCALNKITRLQPVKTLIYPSLTGTPLLTVASGALTIKDDNTEDLYINTSAFSFDALGAATPEFQCLLYGEVQPSNTTTFTQTTPVVGVSTITWSIANDEVVGRYRETDEQLRLRRLVEINNTQKATETAIFSRLAELVGSDNVAVYSNRTMVTDGDGRPAKSFECVVWTGDNNEIAETIWDTAPAGIQMYGNTNVTITDTQGFDQVVTFTRPTEIDIYMRVNVYNSTGSLSAGYITELKNEIITLSESKTLIGQRVDAHDYYQVFDTIEIDYASGLQVSDDNATWGQLVDITNRQIASFSTSNITITVGVTT